MALFPTNAAQVQTFATALYGVAIGSTTMSQVTADIQAAGGLNNALNAYYSASFGSATTASVAATIVANVGLAADANAIAFVTAQLNAAAPTARGAAVIAMLDNFLNTTTGTYAAAATAFNATVANAVSYTGSSNVASGSAPAAISTFALTTGVDNITVSGNAVINATDNAGVATWTGLDVITGTGSNNTFNISSAAAIALPAGATVNGIQTLNAADSNAAITLVTTTGWAGLTQITTNQSSANTTSVTAAATTNVTEIGAIAGAGLTVIGGNNVAVTGTADAITVGFNTVAGGASPVGTITTTNAAAAATQTAVYGGTNVSVSEAGVTTGNVIVGSATVAPTGTVTVSAGAATTATMGTIVITGGTAVNVTETATNTAGAGAAPTMGAVTVNGGAATTSVTVTQSPVATDAAAGTAVAGTLAVTAVTAAPGTQGVAPVTAVNAKAAVTAAVGVTADGLVTIVDKNYNTTSANTISTISLSSYGANSVIQDNALTNLSLSGTAGTLAITNATSGGGATPTANSTLNLTVNNLSGTNTVTDTNNEITTLNVTTGATKSTLAAFADTGLTALNITGSSVLTLSAINGSLKTLSLSGAAGFSDGATTATTGLAALGSALTITNTSSGAFSAALDSTKQTFTGSTGTDTIIIKSTTDATKAIAAGSASNDVLVLEGGAYALTSATASKVTGFEQLSVAANVTGTIDVGVLGTTFNTLNTIGSGTIAFTNTAQNLTLNIPVATTSTSVAYGDGSGATDAITVNLGKSTTTGAVNFGTVVAADANGVGIGTVNLVSNGVNIASGGATASMNTLVLTDNGLSQLNVSGTDSVTITTINEASTQATSLTINNTNTGAKGLTIGTLTDAVLGALTFTGNGATTISTLTDANASTLTITNSGTAVDTISAITASGTLTKLNLNGQIQVGTGLVNDAAGIILSATTGVTVSGATDNQHVAIINTGAAANGATNTYTLGNGNNTITDPTVAGKVVLNLGTGANNVLISTGTQAAPSASTSGYTITFAAHTSTTSAYDLVAVSAGPAGGATTSAPLTVITGLSANDVISIADATSSAQVTTAQQTAINALATEAAAINYASSVNSAQKALAFQYGGNTYIVEDHGAAPAAPAAGDTVVKLVGLHTIATGTTTGILLTA